MGMLPPVVVELRALNGDLRAKIGEAKAEIAGLESSTNAGMAKMGVAGKAAAAGIAVIGVAAIAAAGEAVHMASEFQKSTTELITGAGESEKNIDLVRKGILAMAGSVGAMPAELSKGMFLIESAGYHGAQGLSVLKAAAEGAKVGGTDMQTVANGLTTAMTDYNIPASRANAVTSALVQTVASGKMHMGELANSLGMVMPKASALGVSFQDVTGGLATMTGAGMSARRASMNLANTIMALGAPSKGAATALTGIGLTAQQVKDSLSSKGLAGTMAMITDHIGTKFPKGSVDAVNALKKIMGGTTGYGTALALTGTHAAAFAANVKGIGGALNGQTGEVQGFAEVQKDLSFQVDAAKATMSAWAITIGTALLPIVTKAMVFINTTAIPALKDLAKGFTEHVLPAVKDIVKWVGSTLIPAIKDLAKWFATNLLPTIKDLAKWITGTLLPTIKDIAKWIGTNLVGAVKDIAKWVTDTAIPAIKNFGKAISDNQTPIKVVAGVITAVLLPAFLKAGVQATVSAAKQAVAWAVSAAAAVLSGTETIAIYVLLGVSAVTSTAVQVAQFIIGGAKWVWSGVKALASAGVHVVAWLMSSAAAIAATVVSVAQFVIQGAKWVWMGVMAMANAAVIAAAWLISMGPIGLIIIAVAALGVFIATHMDQIKKWIGDAWTWIGKVVAGVWDNVLRPTFKFIVDAFLGLVGAIIHGAADAFGWVPGLGGKLKDAAKHFDTFRDGVNASLSGIKDQTVAVAVGFSGAVAHPAGGTSGQVIKGMRYGYAAGGSVWGGTPGVDSVPAMLMPHEFVVTANGSNLGEAINHFGKGMAGGGFVVNAATPSPSQVGASVGAGFAGYVRNLSFSQLLSGGVGGGGGMAGSGVQRWLPTVLQALGLTGEPASMAQTLLRRMNQESGGDPTIVNHWDSNAMAGHPSGGLMQTIQSTFDAYRMAGLSNNMFDPLSNIVASIRYAEATYGSLPAAYNSAGGYDSGGLMMPGATGHNYGSSPERVLSGAQTKSFDRLVSILEHGGGTGGGVHIENYNEAHRPPHQVAADLAFLLRTA